MLGADAGDRIERELRLLRRVSTLIVEGMQGETGVEERLHVLLDRLAGEIAGATQADAASIFLRAADGIYVLRATRGLVPGSVDATTIRPGEGLSGHAVAERRIISVADGPADPRYVHKAETGEERFRGFLAAPILRDDQVPGILVLHFYEPRAASGDEIRLIAALAEQLGFALVSARLYAELRERTEEMERMYEVARTMGTSLDLKGVLAAIVTQAIRIVPARAAVLRSYDMRNDQLVVEAVAGDTSGLEALLAPVPVGDGVAGRVARDGRPIVVQDLRADPRAERYPGCSNILSVPLVHADEVIGTLALIDRRSAFGGSRLAAFTERDQRMLSVVAQAAAEAYSRAELYAEMEAIALTYKRRNHELTILNHISREIQGSIQLDEILYVILTGITSGHGLGYNRAAALLIDEQTQELYGAFGIGATYEEVNRVWTEAPELFRTLEDYFSTIDLSTVENSAFNRLIRGFRIPMRGDASLLTRVVTERRAFNVRNTQGLLGADKVFAELIRSRSCALVPVWTKDLVIGVVVVDNCFTQKPILDEELVLLQTIANQCGLAIDGARMVNELTSTMNRLDEATGRLMEAERLAAIGEVAAGVAHDIRNPLTAIGGFTRRLARRLPPEDSGHRYIEIITKEVARLEKLAGEVLDLAGNRPRQARTVDLMGLARQWRDTNGAVIRYRKIRFRSDSAPVVVQGDPVLLGQALTNILLNAVDAITAAGRESGEIECRGRIESGWAHVAIRDNGCGMSDEQLERIFKPFYTTKTEGTGLGLALARKAILAHGGRIDVQSTPGEGTTMTLVVPVDAVPGRAEAVFGLLKPAP